MQLTFYQPAVKRAVTYVYYIQNDLFLLQMHKKKKSSELYHIYKSTLVF